MPKGQKFPPEAHAKAIAMRRAGSTILKIAAEIGASQSVIKRWLKKKGKGKRRALGKTAKVNEALKRTLGRVPSEGNQLAHDALLARLARYIVDAVSFGDTTPAQAINRLKGAIEKEE